MENKFILKTNKFIIKANEIHCDKYDYSLVNYINKDIKVKIICPEHGVFEQAPVCHVTRKQGCPKCSGKVYSNNDFIEKANKIHKNFYDYSEINYINAKTKIKIICKEHGEFLQTPDKHINSKQGCPKCGLEKSLKFNSLRLSDLDSFIKKMETRYPERDYDYSKSVYSKASNKISVYCNTCNTHFNASPNNLLRGHISCKCEERWMSNGERIILDVLNKNNKNYIFQHSINYLNNRYYLDFYLLDDNLVIEYNGKQHYEYIPFFHRGGKADLDKQKSRDSIIKNYCLKNNLKLEIIKYDENVEMLTNKIISYGE